MYLDLCALIGSLVFIAEHIYNMKAYGMACRKQEGGLTGDEKPGWEEVELPLDEFVLTYRGRVVEHNVEMNKSKITGLGISLLGHEEQPEGSYSLDVQWIKARHAADVPGKPIELDGDSTGRRVEGL